MVEATLHAGVDSAAALLAEEFGATAEIIHGDLETLLRTLEERRFLCSQPRPPTRRRRVRGDLAKGLLPLLAAITRSPLSLRTQAGMLLTLAYLATRLFGWSATVRAWTAPWGPAARQGNDAAVDAIGAAVRYVAARHPLSMECKERALASWALARAQRLPARVVLGISFFPLSLHAWAESGSRAVTDRYDGFCDRYTPLLSYGGDGLGMRP